MSNAGDSNPVYPVFSHDYVWSLKCIKLNFRVGKHRDASVHSLTCVILVTNMYFTWVLHENKLNKTLDYTSYLLLNLVVECCLNHLKLVYTIKIFFKYFCRMYVVYLT